jgi:hypothetical protein
VYTWDGRCHQPEIHVLNMEFHCLMFVPCIIRHSRNNQYCALICTTPLFCILAPTCFGSSLPSSWSFLDPSELLKIKIEQVVYHIMCGYVACVRECSQLSWEAQQTAHRPRNHTLYDIPPVQSVFQVTQTDPRNSLMMACVPECHGTQHTGNLTTHYMIYHPFDLYFK